MWLVRKLFLAFGLLWIALSGRGQRVYRPNSVLATGTWYKLSVSREGVYKMDLPFLSSLGINTSNLSSSSIQLFGNGGQMLGEGNAEPRADDLQENAIAVVDGGDGLLNGSDYILFYAPGPHSWRPDSLNKRFVHEKNIYSDSAYYFLLIGNNGKRIQSTTTVSSPNITINSFNERFFHELDSINLLSSGKEWFGEEFSDAPGKTLSRTFLVPLPGLQLAQPVTIITNCIARSIGAASRFDVRVNGQNIQQLTIPQTGAGIYDLFAQQVHEPAFYNSSQENISLNYTYVTGGFNSQGWLNYFELHARRTISVLNGQLSFRDWNSVGNNVGEFVIVNANSATEVWEVTDPLNAVKREGTFSANEFRFVNDCNRLREYIAFNPSSALIPVANGRIANQNLHGTTAVDHIIITHPILLTQAERLAEFHRQRSSLRVLVTTTDKVFNEFASGSPDPTAIRDVVKMFYDKGTTANDKPKYLLLFGDASFDYKNRLSNNTNMVPAYESSISIDPLSTYTSDDYFGFLDDNEDINSGLVTNLLDIGIGRVPAKNIDEAKNFVDKVLAYHASESLGQWRTNLTLVADDEDLNLHLNDAELLSATSHTTNPIFNQQKIYLDAYQQQSSSAGGRYPQVNEAINNRILNGTLIWNYNGHGGSRRLAEEVILDLPMVNSWQNKYRLPLVITATCDFAPYDDPFNASLGENLLLRAKTGSIALMTTTRLVFSFSNRLMNEHYLKFALERDANGRYRSLGEAVQAAKNHTYQTSGDIINNRKFTLLGDPAMTLGFPSLKVKTVSISDTLSAGEKAVIEGEITDNNGSILSQFNGTVYPVVYDKPQIIHTLGNDAASPVTSFPSYSTIIFKGKSTVQNGRFRFEFKVPRDINFVPGNGRISYYADNGSIDAADVFTNFIVGGSSTIVDNDREGPVIKAYLNDELFVNGSIVNQKPILLLKLSDSSGINTTGVGIGHDISVTINNDNNQYYVLNDYYESDVNDFTKGIVRFQLPEFVAGTHSLRIKAWDAMNNSSEIILEFTVVNDEQFTISHVLNYPNPFTTRTQFWFEHNKPGQDMFVQIHIYSLSGRIIRTIEKTINTIGNRSNELEWDARDEFGQRVGRGVYLYRIKIQTPGSKPRSVIEKLVVL